MPPEPVAAENRFHYSQKRKSSSRKTGIDFQMLDFQTLRPENNGKIYRGRLKS